MSDGLKTFGLPDAAKSIFFGDVDDVDKAASLNGQSHYMRRAFTEMKLDGILCIDGKPTVYLKDYKRPVHRSEVERASEAVLEPGNRYVAGDSGSQAGSDLFRNDCPKQS